MGAPEIVTVVALVAAAALLAVAAITDLRERRIPNLTVLALASLWLAWRLALGIVALFPPAEQSAMLAPQAAFTAAFMGQEPFGLPDVVGSLSASLAFGLGLLALTLAYEALAKKEALGGGDIKLVAALALFLGPARMAVCLLVACVVALLNVFAGRSRRQRLEAAAREAADSSPREGAGNSQRSEGAEGVIEEADAFPFAPALAVGSVIALMPGTNFLLIG